MERDSICEQGASNFYGIVGERYSVSSMKISFVTLGLALFAKLKANARLNKNRTYLAISAFKPEEEIHELTLEDIKSLNEAETAAADKEAQETEAAESSEEEWMEQVDRQWKKQEVDASEDVEAMKNIDWEFGAEWEEPVDLYNHADDTPPEELKIRKEFAGLFNDPVKGFLAFMPLDFWRSVLRKTNEKAAKLRDVHAQGYVGGRAFTRDFTLEELMKFLGLMVMMSVVRAGEYRLYWECPDVAAFLLPGMQPLLCSFSNLCCRWQIFPACHDD